MNDNICDIHTETRSNSLISKWYSFRACFESVPKWAVLRVRYGSGCQVEGISFTWYVKWLGNSCCNILRPFFYFMKSLSLSHLNVFKGSYSCPEVNKYRGVGIKSLAHAIMSPKYGLPPQHRKKKKKKKKTANSSKAFIRPWQNIQTAGLSSQQSYFNC